MLRIGLAAVAVALAGCSRGTEPGDAQSGAPTVARGADAKDLNAYFPLKVGARELRVQVAVTLPEMQRGLMGRRELGPDEGMIFVYPAPQQLSFWMKNTPLPLDIGFFTPDGTLGEVYPLYPYDETPVNSTGLDYSLALEVNQGWFAKHGIKPGAKLNMAQLADALRARGFEPRRYGVTE